MRSFFRTHIVCPSSHKSFRIAEMWFLTAILDKRIISFYRFFGQKGIQPIIHLFYRSVGNAVGVINSLKMKFNLLLFVSITLINEHLLYDILIFIVQLSFIHSKIDWLLNNLFHYNKNNTKQTIIFLDFFYINTVYYSILNR